MSLKVRVLDRAADVSAADWDRLAGGGNPFAAHAFYTSLEDSGSATAAAGWQAAHIALEGEDGLAGLLPGYVKSHSQGEYVFDHSWADAWHRAGQDYYPKLQHSTPFTPASAPKLLAVDADAHRQLVAASEALVVHNGLSSAHATFLTAEEAGVFETRGWLPRYDVQFHWPNEGYAGFDDFLGSLSSRKRKGLRKERETALSGVDSVEWLTGADLTEAAWDSFFAFYQDTGSRKWGRPYLTRAFFSLIGERMGDRLLLVMAKRAGRYVAGALNFIGEDTLFGRQWGCVEDIPFLHFELCYHQAMDFACQRGLKVVEAGAQGPHKLARGYKPVLTRSCHYIAHPQFRVAVADFLERERQAVERHSVQLDGLTPYKKSG